ncbi:MAG: hypothetical protein SFW35_04920 [Chitinophagales bacterium]|nr:hypothetical protein [Chitinophagales bacterium]
MQPFKQTFPALAYKCSRAKREFSGVWKRRLQASLSSQQGGLVIDEDKVGALMAKSSCRNCYTSHNS